MNKLAACQVACQMPDHGVRCMYVRQASCAKTSPNMRRCSLKDMVGLVAVLSHALFHSPNPDLESFAGPFP